MSKSTTPCYVDQCCFCINLKTGCFILGYMGLIGIIVGMVMVGLAIATIISLGEQNGKVHDIIPLFVLLTGVIFVFLILALIFNIVLLVGLHKEKPGHVKAYLIYNTVFLVVFAIILVVTVLLGYIDASNLIARVVQLLVSTYFMLVIRSHYLNMKDPSKQTV